MTPELRSMREKADSMETKSRILRLGIAAVLSDEAVGLAEVEVCSGLMAEVLVYAQEANTLYREFRKAEEEADAAEQAALRTEGNVQ